MVAAGGVGVLVVVAFVAAVALGARTPAADPGERLAVGRVDDRGTLAVFVPRCRSERVTGVGLESVGGAGDRVLWRIEARKGSIDERYVVGADEVPVGFEVVEPLDGDVPAGELTAIASIDGDEATVEDRQRFEAADLPAEGVLYQGAGVDLAAFSARARSAANCPESTPDLAVTALVFGAGAFAVVGAYLVMVGRWWRGRTS